MNHRRLIHLGIAGAWTVAIIPAALWWSEAVFFVIVASVWANVYAAIAASEAADNALTDEDKAWILEALAKQSQEQTDT